MSRFAVCVLLSTLGVAPEPSIKTQSNGGKASVAPVIAALSQQSLATAIQVKSIQDRLAMPIDMKGFEANTELQDAVGFLGDKFSFTIVINSKAFDEDLAVKEVERQTVKLPKLSGVSIAKILQLILDQVNGEFAIRRGFVEVTTRQRNLPAEAWATLNPADRKRIVPMVDATFEKKPLDSALRELSNEFGVNIVLDGRCEEQGKKPITARLHDVPADTAVELLSDMCGLKVIARDNVLYVTTPENANSIRAHLAERHKEECKPCKAQLEETAKPAIPPAKTKSQKDPL